MFAVLVDSDGPAFATGGLACHVVQIRARQPHVLLGTLAAGRDRDPEASGVVQLEGGYWLVGRIRLDSRRALEDKLGQRTGEQHRGQNDALLCLHAYATWGEAFIEELAGDFCFALWDDERRCLIAARDRLGVRPLFHARMSTGGLMVSDSLPWLLDRLAPGRDLDDLWIADFLCLGYSRDADRTVYRRISRLPPAHLLTFVDGKPTTRRYWRLALDEPLRLDGRGYVERFLDVTSQAIADRLPAGRVGIAMSGGLDSTTLAACAVQTSGDPARVVAECLHFEAAMHDEEKHFATLVARHLGIELRLRAADDLAYDPAWRARAFRLPEPSVSAVRLAHDRRIAREQAAVAGVWFFGEGPDNALVYERDAYLAWLLQRRDWARLAEATLSSLLAKGVDGWGATLARLGGRHAVEAAWPALPPWLDRGLIEALNLEERLADTTAREAVHPWHPKAVASFNDAIWPSLLEEFDYDSALSPVVWRHPYLDLRVLEFLLSVPPVPWARRKLLLRRAMRDRLPRAVLERRKAPLAQSPLVEPLRRHGLPGLSPGGPITRYVDVRRVPAAAVCPASQLNRLLAVHALDHWLGV
ncbi:MAG: asparagine synthase-related protein [Reyranellaceae bacterium]